MDTKSIVASISALLATFAGLKVQFISSQKPFSLAWSGNTASMATIRKIHSTIKEPWHFNGTY